MRRRDFGLMVGPSVLLMVLLLSVPLAYSLVWSFERVSYGSAGSWVGWANYTQALDDPTFRAAVRFTIGFTVVNTVTVLILGYGLALLLERVRRGRQVFLGLMLVPYVIPSVIAATAFSWLFDDNFGGVINNLLHHLIGHQFLWFTSTWPNRTMILAEALWAGAPFIMLVLLGALQGVPRELLEASVVDGASWAQQQRHVVIPVLGPMFRFLALITVMDSLRLFDSLIALAPSSVSDGTQSISLYVYQNAFAHAQQDLGLGSAVNILSLVLLLVLSMPFVRQIYREVRVA